MAGHSGLCSRFVSPGWCALGPAVFCLALVLGGCKAETFEADDPGECSDAADNDLDGLFDCDDPDCYASPACHAQGYRSEANLFDELLSGADQLDAVCSQMAKNNTVSVVRDVFCTTPAPRIGGTLELLEALGLAFDGPGGRYAQMAFNSGNPGWSLVGHSASLSRRITSPVNPRAIIHTVAETHLEPTPGFVTVAFVRGEGFAEIITHNPDNDELDFFLLKYDFRCAAEPERFWDSHEQVYFWRQECSDEERFSEQVESGWTGYSLYHHTDLENTVLDCLVCHQHGLRSSSTARPSLLMFELNSMWIHWFYDNQYFNNWVENPTSMGPFHVALQQYVTAHATEAEPLGGTYAGIPDGAVYGSRPKSLEDFIEGNGFGNGFDNNVYEADANESGLLEDHRARGMFHAHSWEELYALNLHGLMIAPPGKGEIPFDWNKLTFLLEQYNAYRRGVSTEFPDVSDIFEEASLAAVGLAPHPGLNAPEILVQSCAQCHHDALNPTVSRARFKIGPSAVGQLESREGDYVGALELAELQTLRNRINLPEDHLQVMPPFRIRSLNADQRELVTTWIDGVIDGLKLEDDQTPPTPLAARFDVVPGQVSLEPSSGSLQGQVWHNPAPHIRPALVAMRAVPGSDESGYVEYYFEETSNNPGDDSSGWQISPRYLDTGLVLDTAYSYRVKMRDRAGNEGEWSEVFSYFYDSAWSDCDDFPPDQDCDTVPDSEELPGDTDGDGIPDIEDRDDDGDGIDSQTEVEDGQSFGNDPDGDGLMNWVDDNSDGDLFTDLEEGGGYSSGNPIPVYLNAAEPCGNGSCDATIMGFEENCATCPLDCGDCL
ncbi:MAG: hypothetical protein CMP23_17015 [Rickettsiales bacterium]|nr:hypothetical protein [Rickettsiales bacterium]